jgi:chitinase
MSTYYSAPAYHYDTGAQAPFLSLDGQGSPACTYLTYEDPTSIAAKGAWSKAQGLGGVVIWTIPEGYMPSAGTTPAEQNPMLEAVRKAYLE